MASGAIATALPRALPLRSRGGALVSALLLAAISAAGLSAFLYPFLLSSAPGVGEGSARSQDAPLIFAIVLSLSLLLLLVELTRERMNAKTVSLLAVLIVASAAMRLPSLPAGATAFFLLIIAAGYVFGPRQGFLAGAGALFVSAFAVGGFGPWVPYQMFASGWVGMSAGLLAIASRPALREHRNVELGVLALFGAAWGFLFGAIMNLTFWPFAALGESIAWEPGLGLGETLAHYWSFYVLTSLGWDVWGALGNATLILLAGRPVLDLLSRYRDRFQIDYF